MQQYRREEPRKDPKRGDDKEEEEDEEKGMWKSRGCGDCSVQPSMCGVCVSFCEGDGVGEWP